MLNRSCETRHLLPRSQILEERVFENIFYHVVAEFPISYFLWIDDKFCQILFLNLLMWSPHFSFWFVNRESYIVCQWILSQPYISSIHFSWSQCIYFYVGWFDLLLFFAKDVCIYVREGYWFAVFSAYTFYRWCRCQAFFSAKV